MVAATKRALQADTGPDIRLLLHQTAGILHAGRGRHQRRSRNSARPNTWDRSWRDSQALASQVTRWLLATQARLGMTGEARACLAALDDERPAPVRSVTPAR